MDKLKQEEKTQDRVMILWVGRDALKEFNEAMKHTVNAFLNKDKNDK